MSKTGLQFSFRVDSFDPNFPEKSPDSEVDFSEENKFQLISFDGVESLSTPYQYTLKLVSLESSITPQDVVDKPCCITIWHDGEAQQYLRGIVRRFSTGDTGSKYTGYSLVMVPSLLRLSLRHNSRIFQKKSVPDIITSLLSEMGIEDVSFQLKDQHLVRDYCVQYRETDLAFVQRIAAEEGLYYFFEHTQKKHLLHFCDNSEAALFIEKLSTTGQGTSFSVEYNSSTGGSAPVSYIRSFKYSAQSEPASVQLKDYSFLNPHYSFIRDAVEPVLDYQQEGYEHYDFPGRYQKNEISGKLAETATGSISQDAVFTGQKWSNYRLDSLRRNSLTGVCVGNVCEMRCGYKFEMVEHSNESFNNNWLLVSVHHKGEQGHAKAGESAGAITSYNNECHVIPGKRQWRPEPNPKPRVDGPQSALVVGPEGEEIFCDEYGRVKVHFPWDRYSNGDEHSSCWVRVSQSWAGSTYGAMAIPRIGHEVIVSFLEGDPDKPIITGRTYHAANPLPYPLPEHKTRTVLRTETHQGKGYNELRFEDQAGREEIYVHAQKDMNQLVENDRRDEIVHNKHLDVKNDRFSRIHKDDHLTVDGESRTLIKKDQTAITEQTMHIKCGDSYLQTVGDELHIKSGKKMVVEAGTEITLKVGGNFIKIDPSGIRIVGKKTQINSGGSAGNGSGYKGRVALLPGEVEQAITFDEILIPEGAHGVEVVSALPPTNCMASQAASRAPFCIG